MTWFLRDGRAGIDNSAVGRAMFLIAIAGGIELSPDPMLAASARPPLTT